MAMIYALFWICVHLQRESGNTEKKNREASNQTSPWSKNQPKTFLSANSE